MRKTLVGIIAAAALVLASAVSTLAASDHASCVGQFSTFFAHGGGGMHRSAVAQNFAHNFRPAGANVYSQIAQVHGNLQTCFDET